MDIPPPQPTTVNPDSEPPQTQSNTLTKQLIPPPLTNGLLKRHKPLHHHHHHPPPYKECMKNHAAAMGGHALDGCGEFMPSPTSSPTYPTSLKCAACGCHRNFHRREPEESLVPSPTFQHVIEYQPHHRHQPPAPGNSSSYYPSSGPNMLLALSSGKKRFRTKFSQEQKDKMQELAEQVGWKMQKRDEDTINAFCNQIGVDKNVFKVWMHNNNNNNKSKTDLSINGNHNMTHSHDTSFSTGTTGNVIYPKQASSTSS